MARLQKGNRDSLRGRLSRRTALRGAGAAGIATALALPAYGRGALAQNAANQFTIEPNAGSWTTWVLTSGDQLRPDAPPDDAASAAELEELEVATMTGADRARIVYWDEGSPGYRWNEIAMQHTLRMGFGPGDAYRTMALLNTAIYDATIATWDAKYTFNRPRPAGVDASIQTLIVSPASPSYPSEHAATAGAAAAVLSHIFPDAATTFASLAAEAAESHVNAGVEYPSDSTAGMTLGQQVGDLYIEYANTDGSDAEFDPATMAAGGGLWTGEPVYPAMGSWKTWVLNDGAALRPEPPPAWDSPDREAEIDEVKNYPRDAHPFTELFFWPQNPAGRPEPDSGPFSSNQVVFHYAPVMHFVWGPELAQKLFEYRWDANAPRAARAYALVSIAGFDATVASWEAKFHYMTARPNQFDETITTILPTYPIPDYPSAHASTLGGTAEVLAYLFQADAALFQSRADECATSRMWSGIHFRSAADAGVALGRAVGQAVIDHASTYGSD